MCRSGANSVQRLATPLQARPDFTGESNAIRIRLERDSRKEFLAEFGRPAGARSCFRFDARGRHFLAVGRSASVALTSLARIAHRFGLAGPRSGSYDEKDEDIRNSPDGNLYVAIAFLSSRCEGKREKFHALFRFHSSPATRPSWPIRFRDFAAGGSIRENSVGTVGCRRAAATVACRMWFLSGLGGFT